ncbi:MAG: transcriptional regulator [Nitrososphaerota archaeon]|nr:transcriptional regulator [Nitrososphaerota archaeon]
MITAKKRGKFEIYGDILESIKAEGTAERGARMTRVQARSNLAYDRFRKDLATLAERGLVKVSTGDDVGIEITKAGEEYLSHYREVRRFLAAYGL